MPNDSPCSDGAHSTSAPTSRAAAAGVVERTEPVHGGRLGVATPLHLAGGPVAHHPQHGGPLDPCEGIEHDVEALALLVAPDEQDGRAALLVAHRVGRLETRHVHAVEEHLEGATAGASPVSRAASDTATRTCMRRPTSSASGLSTGTQRLTPARWYVPTMGSGAVSTSP